MNIRKASVEDASEIKELVSSLSHFYLKDENSLLPEWFSKTLELSEFELRLSSEDFSSFVYSINDVIVGYISIKESSHLYHLFVAENYQGKGIAKELWNYATSDSGIDIYTVRSSIFAVPVYRRFGFKESEEATSKDGISFQSMVLVRS
ncbi:GNAT family N-acetyltransferase [Marinobacter confluentis]|uniref:GNAT family N-acetyltransferase n=1 Tax=Marinobacter confluentis TaxID=1697557 RepID=A0A4Z1BPX0_9GAMM|nr:GNAT family N-acetyltransferase [Marinobacter confluentis]TGN39121.1 GNAT family N-acetyltransferase [Marinobacter confluentis]